MLDFETAAWRRIMPIVRITFLDGAHRTYTREVSAKLPKMLAEVLSTEEGGVLKPEDIIVITKNGDNTLMDRNLPDMLIEIEAHHYKERLKRSSIICHQVKEDIDKFLSERKTPTNVSVILKLMHIHFA